MGEGDLKLRRVWGCMVSEKGTQPRGRPERGEDSPEQLTVLSPALVKTFGRAVWSLVCFLEQTKQETVCLLEFQFLGKSFCLVGQMFPWLLESGYIWKEADRT